MVLRAGSAEDGPAVLASPLLRLHSSSAESEADWPRPLSGEQLAQRPPSSERSESFTAPQETEAAVAEAEPENEAEVALTEADLAEETRKAAREMAQVARQFQITAVVESRRIMQLFFAKKFCQLDQPANIFSSAADAAEAIAAAPDAFGLVLANFADLRADGLEETAHALLAAQSDRPRMSLVAYDVSCFDEVVRREELLGLAHEERPEEQSEEEAEKAALLQQLEACGVDDVLRPPYTLGRLQSLLLGHQRRLECFLALSLEAEALAAHSQP
jgi:hypothetical protein